MSAAKKPVSEKERLAKEERQAHELGGTLGMTIGGVAGGITGGTTGAGAGAGLGLIGGPAGAAIGGAIGGVAGEAIARDINPTAEDLMLAAEAMYKDKPPK